MKLRGYGRHEIDDDDIAAVTRVLRGDTLTGGPAVAGFEAALARATGAPHAVACANGTAALHLAAWTLGIGPGDTVIVPTLTFLASANAARYVGAEVEFADVDPRTGLMTVETLLAAEQRALGRGAAKIAAIVAVHLNGQCADLPGLTAVTRDRGWRVIEDGCHALGSRYARTASASAENPVGDAALSDAVCFSFHPVKTIAMGEGGAVTTRDPSLAERLSRLRNHGIMRRPEAFEYAEQAFDAGGKQNPWYHEMPEIGHNFRVSDINCALGESQLTKLDGFIEKRRELAGYYDQRLPALDGAVSPVGMDQRETAAWHIYVVQIDFEAVGKSRAQVMDELAGRGIGTQVHYIPVHRQPYYRHRYGLQQLPGADAYYRRALTLPLFPSMTEADVDEVVGALTAILRVNVSRHDQGEE